MRIKRFLGLLWMGPALVVALTATAAGAPPASAAATGAGPASSSVAQLSGYACVRARDPLLRGMTVTAVMRPLSGTQRLELRFDLLKAFHRAGRYRAVKGKNLGIWFSPTDPATLGQQAGDVWRFDHPVVGLAAPAFYRLRVGFRWVGGGGRILGRQTLLTPICHQLELRPDLAVASLSVQPVVSHPGDDVFTAVVRNRGATGAGPFSVELDLPGYANLVHTVTWLGPHRRKQVTFLAPACASGSELRVLADPGGQVDDYDPANNSLVFACPG